MDETPYKQVPEYKNTSFGAPHVLLLGAGASKAALPDGDASGRQIPLMKDLAVVCGLGEIDPGAEKADNFEAYFSDLTDTKLKAQLERRIRSYFFSLRLPDEATLYDYIVLSLRRKDVIGTFNWDPFLYQACVRNHKVAEMPGTLYLHGSAAVGYCLKDRTKGFTGYPCSQCGTPFPEASLLYPVKKKDYNSDPAISGEWQDMKKALEHAYVFTIFGYSAPETDVEAKDLLREGWGDIEKRNLEEVELINRSIGQDVLDIWSDFIHTHHYRTATDFFESWAAKHPRRTCEAMFEMLMQVTPYRDNPPPRTKDLKELQNWYADNLIKYESPKNSDKTARK